MGDPDHLKLMHKTIGNMSDADLDTEQVLEDMSIQMDRKDDEVSEGSKVSDDKKVSGQKDDGVTEDQRDNGASLPWKIGDPLPWKVLRPLGPNASSYDALSSIARRPKRSAEEVLENCEGVTRPIKRLKV